MKRLQAVIRPEKLEDVEAKLAALGVEGFMVYDVRGHGTESSPTGEWRGVPYAMSVKHKLLVDLLLEDGEVKAVSDGIREVARTGQPGDGLIFVLDVAEVVPIRV